MIVVGADENGLGPDLGPMVVTAVAIECDEYEPSLLSTIGPRNCRPRDSKEIFKGGPGFPRGELVALAWCRVLGWEGESYLDLRRFLAGDGEPDRRCDGGKTRLCEGAADVRLPLWAGEAAVEESAKAIRAALGGVRLIGTKAQFLCARAVCVETARLGSKTALDARLLVEAARWFRSACGEDVSAYCGRASGQKDYRPAIATVLAGYGPAVERSRGPDVSSYRVPGFGCIEFVKSIEGRHAPAALASILGKYLREISLHLICAHVSPGTYASGYPGDKTQKLIEASRARRRAIGLPDECFIRRASAARPTVTATQVLDCDP